MSLRIVGQALEYVDGHERLRIEAWGADSIRVRAAQTPILDGLPQALLDSAPSGADPRVEILTGLAHDGPVLDLTMVREKTLDKAVLTNGAIRVEVTSAGLVSFLRSADASTLIAEQRAHFWWPGSRVFVPLHDGRYRLEQRFAAHPGEKILGLGQHQHGKLDQQGLVIDLVQRNTEVTIPFYVSDRGYGLLWNSPAIGRVEFADNGIRWVADSARQIDYWVTAGTPAQVLANYADATGHSPAMPDWALGFWQCKLRYETQDELMAVAREHHRRGLPMSVIVSDFFHWTQLGDWKFDPSEWPDPSGMSKELADMGVRLMVSVWPNLTPLSENFQPMLEQGLLLESQGGRPAQADWVDRGMTVGIPTAFYDPTNPRARDYLWDRLKENYLAHGIDVWWLDACEPEIKPGYPSADLLFEAGPGSEVANLYPREHARGVYEHMVADGHPEVVSLIRSAWAGSQRWGSLLWSGDIGTTFDALAGQITCGLNTAMSGIPWWTTDIGGFHGGDPDDPAYRELLVRWFWFGVFCPVLRLHGHREPRGAHGQGFNGGPNEVWSYGEQAYDILVEALATRERLRPYLRVQFDEAARSGIPVLRPLALEFPDDPAGWEVADQFLCGRDILVAPVIVAGARSREVYLPAGARWTDAFTGEEFDGGRTVTAEAPLARIPVFLRDDAAVPVAA